MRLKRFVVILSGILLCAACSPAPAGQATGLPPVVATAQEQTPPPAVAVSPSVEEAVPTSPSGGISYEEDLQINPPMPLNLRASASTDGILLEWEPPAPVAVKHDYSDTPLYYRIYRRVAGERAEPVGSSPELRYLDQSAQPGVQYFYQVSAVHENDLEGTRTDEVKAPLR